jgi:hypothetical protein
MNVGKDAARCWRNEIDRKKGWWSVVMRKESAKDVIFLEDMPPWNG